MTLRLFRRGKHDDLRLILVVNKTRVHWGRRRSYKHSWFFFCWEIERQVHRFSYGTTVFFFFFREWSGWVSMWQVLSPGLACLQICRPLENEFVEPFLRKPKGGTTKSGWRKTLGAFLVKFRSFFLWLCGGGWWVFYFSDFTACPARHFWSFLELNFRVKIFKKQPFDLQRRNRVLDQRWKSWSNMNFDPGWFWVDHPRKSSPNSGRLWRLGGFSHQQSPHPTLCDQGYHRRKTRRKKPQGPWGFGDLLEEVFSAPR